MLTFQAVTRFPWDRCLLLCALVSCGAVLLPGSAASECTNYENYLHWITSMETVVDPVDIAIQGSYAYVLDSGSPAAFRIVDISDPGNPQQVGLLLGVGGTNCAVSGTRAVIQVGYTLYAVDVSDPTSPAICDSEVVEQGIRDVALVDDVIYVAVGADGSYHRFAAYRYCPSSGSWFLARRDYEYLPNAIAIQGTYAYLAGGPNTWGYLPGLYILDITTGSSLPVIGQYRDASLDPVDVAVSGDLAFLACRTSGLLIFDISTPASPQLVGTFDSGSCADKVVVSGDYCYLSCADEGVTYIVDVSDPAAPAEVGGITPFGRCTDLAVNGSQLYMLIEDGGVDVIAIESPGGLDPISIEDTPGTAEDIVFSSTRANLLYVADGEAGVRVINVDDPLDPVFVGAVDTPGYAMDLALAGDHAFVADAASGLQVVDVSIPASPAIVADIDTLGMAVDLEIAGSFAYVAVADQGMRIVDISVPAVPTVRGVNDTLTAVQGITVDGQYAYVADGIEGLRVLDVSDPDNPWLIGTGKARTTSGAVEVSVVGGRAYVAAADSSLFIVDVTNPLDLRVLSELRTDDQVRDLTVTGDHAYLANSTKGMQLIDVQDSDSPFIVGNVFIESTSRGVFVTENFAFVAADTAGIMVCPSQCGAYERVTADFTSDVTSAFLPATIAFTDLSLGYIVNYDWDFGDGAGHSTEVDPVYTFQEQGEYDVTLTVTGLATTDVKTTTIHVLSEPPLITQVVDVPDDQGGFVYVDFARSGYDDTSPGRAELYTIQRQDAGVWRTVATSGAYGDLYYSVVVQTQGDGAAAWTTPFRVIAHMDEGIWIGPTVTGFSEDNIAPAAPENVAWLGDGLLRWDAVADTDFAYYKIYGGPGEDFALAEPVAATTETEIDLGSIVDNWFFVVAVDDADLESEPSTPVVATSVPGAVPGITLGPAYPNPANPRTTIEFTVPAAGRIRLSIYDVGGRLVSRLVDGVVAAGRHDAVWQGQGRDGRAAASGTYFSRLEAGGLVLTGRVMLVR